MSDWDNVEGDDWGNNNSYEDSHVEHVEPQHEGDSVEGVDDTNDNDDEGINNSAEEMLDSVEEMVAAPRNSKNENFTWKDMANFANFAIAFYSMSEAQKHLVIVLSGARKNADAADVGAALLKNNDSVEALNILAPSIHKVVQGKAGMLEGVTLAAGINTLSDSARLSLVKIMNEALLLTEGGGAIRWSKNAGAEALSSKVVESFGSFVGNEQVESLVTVTRDVLAMWPGDR